MRYFCTYNLLLSVCVAYRADGGCDPAKLLPRPAHALLCGGGQDRCRQGAESGRSAAHSAGRRRR